MTVADSRLVHAVHLRSRAIATLTLTALLLSGCVRTGPGMTADIERETRSTLDAIAAEVGPTLRVTMDAVHPCDPARPDFGEEFVYGLMVETTPGARERLLGDFATTMRAEGWEVTTRGESDINFRRGNATLGATVDSRPEAYVSGSSGCH